MNTKTKTNLAAPRLASCAFLSREDSSGRARSFEEIVMTQTQIKWTKLPSVTRTGRWFYRGKRDETVYTILQSFLTGLWIVNDNCGSAWGSFNSAFEAQLAIENMQ